MPVERRKDIRSPYPWLAAAIFLLCGISLCFRWFLLDRMPFIMDEFVDTQLGIQVGRGLRIYLDYPWERTPLLTLLIGSLVDPGAGSFAAIVSARRLMWGGTFIIFIGTFLTARNIFGSRLAPLSVFLLCGFSSFLDHSIAVRADLVSTTLSLPAFYLVTSPVISTGRLFIAGAFIGFSAAASQKALYFALAFAAAFTGRYFYSPNSRARMVREYVYLSMMASAGFIASVSMLLFWAYFSGILLPFLRNCLFTGYYVGLSAKTYRFTTTFVWQSFSRNPGFWVSAIGGVVYLLLRPFPAFRLSKDDSCSAPLRSKPGEIDRADGGSLLALGLWTLVLLVLYARHTAKFPYIFINLGPCLAVAGSATLAFTTGRILSSNFGRLWKLFLFSLSVLILLVAMPTLFHLRHLQTNLVSIQRAILDRVDAITEPDDSVFDGIGMAVTRRKATPYSMTARWFQERWRGANYPVIDFLKKSEPKVVIFNYRFASLRANEITFISKRFVPDWSNVWVVGSAVPHPGKGRTLAQCDMLSSATYAILSRAGTEVTIDGRRANSYEYLRSGRHEIAVVGDAQTVIVKLARAHRLRPPPPFPVVKQLFPEYSF